MNDSKSQLRSRIVYQFSSNKITRRTSAVSRMGLLRGLALGMSAFLFASCTSIRVDSVEEERFDIPLL